MLQSVLGKSNEDTLVKVTSFVQDTPTLEYGCFYFRFCAIANVQIVVAAAFQLALL
jgi:hypothetical protein